MSDDKYSPLFGIIVLVIIPAIISALMLTMITIQGCSSMPAINWNQVIAAIQEYQDDIPWDKLEDALKKVKK